MEDDIAQVSLEPLREMTKALIDICTDADLLDLVHKLLLSA